MAGLVRPRSSSCTRSIISLCRSPGLRQRGLIEQAVHLYMMSSNSSFETW